MGQIIAYGAGKMARRVLPELSRTVQISEVWDAYTKETAAAGIPIRPPAAPDAAQGPVILLVLVEAPAVKSEIFRQLRGAGYRYLYDYPEFLNWLHLSGQQGAQCTPEDRTEAVIELLLRLTDIADSRPPVLWSRLYAPQTLSCPTGGLSTLRERLHSVLRIDDDVLAASADRFARRCQEPDSDFRFALELFLRDALAGGVKTRYRPIRMAGDRPYDPFAVYESVLTVVKSLTSEDDRGALTLARELRMTAERSRPLLALECHFLMKNRFFQEALELARQACHWYPNDLLVNEAFYEAAVACKASGIPVEEPLPGERLDERFCWCGVSFAWCGGADARTGEPVFGPCFRPNQCAAQPDGPFWTGGEWAEFRRSVTDGSFRYCQKTACPNLTGGWLPRKADVQDATLRRLLAGDRAVVPPLEELHLSYDTHCNLCCPSCRTEFHTNTDEENRSYDKLYVEHLRPLVPRLKHLCLSGCGEAMLSPHSRRILHSLSRKEYPDLEVELRTNVTSVTPLSWERLGPGREVIRHIAVSIDGAEKETFERLRYPASWERVCGNLAFISSLRNRGEIDLLEFHVVAQAANVTQLYAIAEMAVRTGADCVTYSRIVNWRGMTEAEYAEMNPFWPDHPLHGRLLEEFQKLDRLRRDLLDGTCSFARKDRLCFINLHNWPDPDDRYDAIRSGRFRIR